MTDDSVFILMLENDRQFAGAFTSLDEVRKGITCLGEIIDEIEQLNDSTYRIVCRWAIKAYHDNSPMYGYARFVLEKRLIDVPIFEMKVYYDKLAKSR